jgi:sulfonate dioxygenase
MTFTLLEHTNGHDTNGTSTEPEIAHLKGAELYKYDDLKPVFDATKYPPLEPFEHVDPGHRALKHENPVSFLNKASFVQEITPVIGTEVHGVDLLDLNSDERDQVALAVARRKVMVFRDQERFIDSGVGSYREWGSHFGRLHIHPASGHPQGAPEIHLVYRDDKTTYNYELDERTTTAMWHTDVSYELQPPGLTTFFLLAQRKCFQMRVFIP